jgi:hypothetical protein
MAFSLTITEPDSDAVYTNAYGKVDSATLTVTPDGAQVVLNWYYSQATSRMKPVRSDPVTIPGNIISTPNTVFVGALQQALAAGSIQSPIDALKASLYFLLLQLPAYAGAVQV